MRVSRSLAAQKADVRWEQVDAAFETAISTIVFNAGLTKAARKLWVEVDRAGTNAPRRARLTAYKDAMWAGFAFSLCGKCDSALIRGLGRLMVYGV